MKTNLDNIKWSLKKDLVISQIQFLDSKIKNINYWIKKLWKTKVTVIRYQDYKKYFVKEKEKLEKKLKIIEQKEWDYLNLGGCY